MMLATFLVRSTTNAGGCRARTESRKWNAVSAVKRYDDYLLEDGLIGGLATNGIASGRSLGISPQLSKQI
jgi:hypothetical protein